MKYFVRFFVIILITFYSITLAKADSFSLVYINMDKVMNETIAGKYLIKQLEKIHKKNIEEFKKIEEDIKTEESSILSKKNILSSEEYSKKVDELKNKISNYKKNRQIKVDSISKKKIDATSKLLKEITPILADYSKKNKISIILKKKDILLGRTDLDITNEIIDIVNSKVKKINLN